MQKNRKPVSVNEKSGTGFCIPKYISEVAGGKFVVSLCIHKMLPELYFN